MIHTSLAITFNCVVGILGILKVDAAHSEGGMPVLICKSEGGVVR